MINQPVDVYIAARVFLDQQGRESALAICERSEDDRYEVGDLLGVASWRNLRSAILEITRPAPAPHAG